MHAPSDPAGLDTIQRPALPPLPPAIQSPEMLDAPEAVFAPVGAAALATARAPVDSPTPSPDLAPKGYRAKTIVTYLVRLVGGVFLCVLAFVGFRVVQQAMNTSLVTELSSGQCVEEFFTPSDGEFRNVFTVATTDCANPHAYEVFEVSTEAFVEASTESNAQYPGIEGVFAVGQEFCLSQYDEFVGGDFATSPWQVWTFVPTEKRWSEGDRNVQCLVGDAAETNLTEGSLKGAGD